MEQSLTFDEFGLFSGSECEDMQKWEDFHNPISEVEDEPFKTKCKGNKDENLLSFLSCNHDISTVPNWMTNDFSFAAPDSDNFEFEANCDPKNVPAVTVGLSQEFSDENLKRLSVKELNKLIKQKGLSKDDIAKIKYQRRTIKNRGYAQNCRIKRIKQKQNLEEKNLSLTRQVETLMQQLQTVIKERDEIKNKYKQIKKFVLANHCVPK